MKDSNAFVAWLKRTYPDDHARVVLQYQAAVAESVRSFGKPRLVQAVDDLTPEQITAAIQATVARWQPEIDAYQNDVRAAMAPLVESARIRWADLQARMAPELDPLVTALKAKTEKPVDLSPLFPDGTIIN